MLPLINQLIFIIFILLLNGSFEAPLFGDCGNIGYKATGFSSCKDKAPYDDSKYCCYIKAGKMQECVEILKKDIDNNVIDLTIKEIEKGIYEEWEDNNGVDLNKYYGEIESLECDKGYFLYFNFFYFFLFILF